MMHAGWVVTVAEFHEKSKIPSNQPTNQPSYCVIYRLAKNQISFLIGSDGYFGLRGARMNECES